MQSLPIALAAIAFVIYGLSFWPCSVERMERSAALIEHVSYYEIAADGKAVAWFKAFDGDSLPTGLSTAADSTVTGCRYIEGVWVNKHAFIPSCHGLILTAISPENKAKLPQLNSAKSAEKIKAAADSIEKSIKLMDKATDEAAYFLSTHNVSDDGYNSVAEFSSSLKTKREKAEKVMGILRSIEGKGRLAFRKIERYTLLYRDTAGVTRRMACNRITVDGQQPYCVLQTADKKKPEGAAALYLHKWFTPTADSGKTVIVAAHPGITGSGFTTKDACARTFSSTVTGNRKVNIPRTLAADGAAVFSERGLLMGISYGGKVIKPSELEIKYEKAQK